MHKVVIVDNEDIITQGIANCFNWCNEGFELIRQTANSKEEICYKDLEQIMNKKITYSIGVDSQMVRAIRKGDLEMAQQSIREYFKYIEVHGFNKNYLFAMLFEFVNSVLRIVLEYNDSIENVFGKEFDPYSELSSKQAISILILFLLGSSLVIGISSQAKQDAWISILLALFMFIPVIFAYIRISSLFPGKNLYDIVTEIFGNIIGKIIIFIYVLYAIHLGALVMRNFSEFIDIIALQETPQIVIQIFLLVFCVWMVKRELRRLAAGVK